MRKLQQEANKQQKKVQQLLLQTLQQCSASSSQEPEGKTKQNKTKPDKKQPEWTGWVKTWTWRNAPACNGWTRALKEVGVLLTYRRVGRNPNPVAHPRKTWRSQKGSVLHCQPGMYKNVQTQRREKNRLKTRGKTSLYPNWLENKTNALTSELINVGQ